MPILNYKCQKCSKEFRKIVHKNHIAEFYCTECGNKLTRHIKSCPDLCVTEKRDEFKNKNTMKNMEEIAKKRSKEYFMKHCVDEAMEKVRENFGEKEAINHAKRWGWIDKYSGKKKNNIDIE